MTLIILKSGQQMHDFVALAKGLISPNDLAVGGQLRPQQADKVISMLFESDFLKKITTTRMSRLTRDVDVMDILARQLVRVQQGSEPITDEMADAVAFGCKLTALDAQLFPSVKLDFLRENADNPNISKMLEEAFAKRLTNDIVDLGFNGVADDGAGNTQAEKFVRLNKGWLQVAREAENTPKVAIDPATNGWIASLKDIKANSDIRVSETATFVMNTADASDYGEEIAVRVTGTDMLSYAASKGYNGNAIVALPYMPRGSVLFTPMENIVYGLHTTIQRDRAYNSRRRAVEYTFDMAFDFEIAVKQFAVLGE